ncbi:proline iminopeptidase [Actinorhabdospora filicis]|uniref:Proline iminopeptidase n=1 Tax=Actinorhabdospora filicis TaxID=1785913 RepID=A0A9W6SFK8_9ACTN|nr:alpha/beta hydrolase [Actinorhabdospora filicis]GLZ75408.1 proline iminopeptidase [Actinorhabdospora filicis]
MAEHMITVPGARLFVDERGPADGPPLLFLHGGPGQSAFDFLRFQADHLAARGLRVFSLDQRGLLRSDPLPEGHEPTVEEIVADCEALREHFGLPAWTVLGHSAGGHYALRYATAHPTALTAAIFDCPAFDCDLTDRARLQAVAALLDDMGDAENAALAREIAARPGRLTPESGAIALMNATGDRRDELFFRDPAALAAYNAVHRDSGYAAEDWRGASHLPLLAAMYTSLLPLLPTLTVPTMLVHGEGDTVAAPAIVDAYRTTAPGARVHTFTGSGHFPYVEEPETYADVIAAFVRERP